MLTCNRKTRIVFLGTLSLWARSGLPSTLSLWARFILPGALCLSLLSGCERCSSVEPLGRLVNKSGPVDKDLAAGPETWNTAGVGTEFDVGDAIRTLQSGHAEVALDDGSVLVMDEHTLVRFLERSPERNEQNFELAMGSAVLEASDQGTVLVTQFGTARIAGKGKLQLRRRGSSLIYRVVVGTARLEPEGGEAVVLQSGGTVVAHLGSAVLETTDQDAPPPDAEQASPPSEAWGPISALVRGDKVQLRDEGSSDFAPLAAGAQTLRAGSTLQIGADSSVVVSDKTSSAELSSGGSYVVGSGGALVRATAGSLSVRTETPVRIAVPGGVIETVSGVAQITASGQEGTLVQVGSGQVNILGTSKQSLREGESATLFADGSISVEGRGLNRADLDIVVGQSLVIHDPGPPTAVGFSFKDKCQQGEIRLHGANKQQKESGDSARGKDWVALSVRPGRVEYTLTCADQPNRTVGRGTLVVLSDSGSKLVPSSAPLSTIDLNGRSYTVLYQNQLPKVALRWSGAPEAASFSLKRTDARGARSYSTKTPSYVFSSGTLGEGRHQFYFEGGGRVSRLTTLNIVFDNATPTASLQTPIHVGGGAGAPFRFTGTVLSGWTISVDGHAVEPDAEGRFSVPTHLPESGRPALLYLNHPSRGTHVYLRRPAGAP